MAQFASDTFTGVDGTTLQAHSVDWVKHSSSAVDLIITGDKVRCAEAGTSTYYHTTDPSSADYSVSADLYAETLLPQYNYTGVGGRIDSSAVTYYQFRYAYGIGWQMMKVVAGVGTTLGSGVLDELPAGNTSRIKLDMAGTTITALVDDVETVTATDSSITAAGKAGLRVFNNGTTTTSDGLRLDNFSADEAGATSHSLAVSSQVLAQTYSSPAATQVHSLSAANSSYAWSVDSVAVSKGSTVNNLTLTSLTQANSLSSPAITQIHALIAQSPSIAWSAGDVFVVVNGDTLTASSQTIYYSIGDVSITVELNDTWEKESAEASSWTLDSSTTSSWS